MRIPALSRSHPVGMGGWQEIYRFENGYGASVVQTPFSYGLELAVVKFSGKGLEGFELVYDTPITNNVIGHLDVDELDEILDQIEAL